MSIKSIIKYTLGLMSGCGILSGEKFISPPCTSTRTSLRAGSFVGFTTGTNLPVLLKFKNLTRKCCGLRSRCIGVHGTKMLNLMLVISVPVPISSFSLHRDVAIGDIVTVGECRPLSKTVRFNVLKVNKAPGTKKGFTKF